MADYHDDVHYYAAPGLAWDAAIRMTQVSLELITDIDMYHFIEKSIRGGISMITTRYARANAPTPPAYDASRPRVNLFYLDANNLYGSAMSQPLPSCGFRFLQPDEIEALSGVVELSDDAEDGYIFEVDLSYPQHLPDAHDDYPLAPDSLEIDRDMCSPAHQAVFSQTAPQRKPTPNLRDKVRYVVNYRNLKLYLQLGLVVIRILKVLTFKQSTWLKTYIDFNTHQHSLAGSSFLKDFFILMNNSVFGKSQENLRKCVQVELITDAGILRKCVAKPNFYRGDPITDCLTAIQCTVATLTLNRPIYVGFSVLRASLAYAVQTEDICRDMTEDAATHYVFIEYHLDHPLYCVMNHKAIGFFKDELNSVPMQQFVGLRPKCYAFLCTGNVSNNVLPHTNPVEEKTIKGVKRRVKDAHLHFAYYLDALNNFHTYLCRQNLIKSSMHTVRTVHTCFTAYDTKRWLCEDTIHSHAHGHFRLDPSLPCRKQIPIAIIHLRKKRTE